LPDLARNINRVTGGFVRQSAKHRPRRWPCGSRTRNFTSDEPEIQSGGFDILTEPRRRVQWARNGALVFVKTFPRA
jgi:hypothetical protein